MLRYLRQHGYYLTPGKGITLTSVIVVLLRGVILNQLVWVPIIAALMWSLIWASQQPLPDAVREWIPAPAVAFVASISPPLRANGDPELFWLGTRETPLFAFGIMLAAAAVLFAGCVLAFAAYSLVTWSGHKSTRWFGGTKYLWRRGFERRMRLPFWAVGVLLLIGSVPFVVGQLHGWLLGSSFSLIGLATGVLTFVRTMRTPRSAAETSGAWSVPVSWIATFGAAFLLYGVLLVAYAFGWWAEQGAPVLGVPAFAVLVAAVVLAILTGWLVDLNLTTIHRFYRDRLMEAFLPDVDQALHNNTAPARQADSAALSGMCDRNRPVGPFHIINTNLVLTKSNEGVHGRRAHRADGDGDLGRGRQPVDRQRRQRRDPQSAARYADDADEPAARILGAEPER
jgi:hypothetical protein